MTLDHDAVVDLLGAYALDAVDGDEAEAVEAHLGACEQCTAELADFREAAGLIANSGGDAPEHLWHSISAEIGSGGQTRLPRTEEPPPIAQVLGTTASRTSGSVPAPRRWNSKPWMVVGIAAGLLVIAALGVQVARLGNRVGQLQTPTAEQSISQAATSALGDPQAQHVELTAAHPLSSAASVAEIAVLPSGSAFLVNRSLPALDAAETYQLWGQVGGRLISLGVLGNAPHDVAFHVDSGTVIALYAVTAERAGGVVRTTHAPVAVSSMAA
jgi:anti-sigma factor RsiW